MHYIYYVYIIVSAALIPILNNFFPIMKESYSWWLMPLLLIGFILIFIILQLLTFALMIQFTNRKKPPKNTTFFRFLVKISLPLIVKVARVKINMVGLEKFPEDTRVMLVCNHQHDFDPAIIMSAFPDAKLGFIGKKEIYTLMPFISKAMHRLNSLLIDRENDREAAKTIINAIKTIKENTASIAIFPEGYTNVSLESSLLPFRNGCFKIATKSNVPIVVCVLNNTREIPKNILRRKTEVEFRLLDVIYPEQFEGMNTTQIGDMIYEKMKTALDEMRNT